ncbi:hypothetical protein GCM10022214_10110 [Actinomadura miaoliensis]|uniref:XRE family transcriptional regulator n=1 Tax=Actinomadura miaoliensis TaxID=430685 RepID=A0ABP7V4W8_9ACTN
MTSTETSRQRLARLMDERRAELRLTWHEVAERAGMTREGLRRTRTGSGSIRSLTKRGIEDALEWAVGSVDMILAGGDPLPSLGPRHDAAARAFVEGQVKLSATGVKAYYRPETIDQLIAVVMEWLPDEPDERYEQVGMLMDALTAEWVRLRRLTGRHVDQRRDVS